MFIFLQRRVGEDTTLNRYSSQYEASLDPFSAFSAKVEYRYIYTCTVIIHCIYMWQFRIEMRKYSAFNVLSYTCSYLNIH